MVLLYTPQNQYACGCCWSFAAAGALSDRVAIAQNSNPALGPSYLISYGLTTDSDALGGCNGGSIQDALQVMTRAPAGTVPSSCWGYEWCINDPNCSSGGDEDAANAIVPTFDPHNCLNDTPIPNLYHVLPNSVVSFKSGRDQASLNNSFAQIRQSIFDKGPMPTGFNVFGDFFLGTAPGADNWAPTWKYICSFTSRSKYWIIS